MNDKRPSHLRHHAGRVSFEYTLLRDVNDNVEHAAALVEWCHGLGVQNCHVNIMYVLHRSSHFCSARACDLLCGIWLVRAHPLAYLHGVTPHSPFNPWPGAPVQASSSHAQQVFVHLLRSEGVNCTIRTTRGRDILAACGQLNTEHAGLSASPTEHRA